MSASVDNKWRRTSQVGGQTPRSQNAGSRDRSGANTPKERQPAAQQSANAWAGHERNRSVAGGQAQDGAKAAKGPAASSAAAGFGGEEHVSVRGFEGAATREWMKRGYQAATAGLDSKVLVWRPGTEATGGSKPAGAWGRKPNAMASGQDFWVHLRRELKNAEQTK